MGNTHYCPYFKNKFFTAKQDAHVCEILSIILSEYNDYYKINITQEAKSAILWNDYSFSASFNDTYKLCKNNRQVYTFF